MATRTVARPSPSPTEEKQLPPRWLISAWAAWETPSISPMPPFSSWLTLVSAVAMVPLGTSIRILLLVYMLSRVDLSALTMLQADIYESPSMGHMSTSIGRKGDGFPREGIKGRTNYRISG